VNQWGLDSDAANPMQAQMYIPLAQLPDRAMLVGGLQGEVFLRTAPRGAPTFETLRRRILEFNGETVVFRPEDMQETVANSIAGKRFSMALLAVFALLALLLAGIGIYGVLSYLVGQRTQEIGVRMALGAGQFDVLRMVLGDGARMILVGIGIGVVAALGLTRLMSSMLFDVSPTDPLTFAGVAMVLCTIALLACYVPARRATKVDPVVALRHE
jgi:ABC-type lipoprotein release transport system permease subunit